MIHKCNNWVLHQKVTLFESALLLRFVEVFFFLEKKNRIREEQKKRSQQKETIWFFHFLEGRQKKHEKHGEDECSWYACKRFQLSQYMIEWQWWRKSCHESLKIIMMNFLFLLQDTIFVPSKFMIHWIDGAYHRSLSIDEERRRRRKKTAHTSRERENDEDERREKKFLNETKITFIMSKLMWLTWTSFDKTVYVAFILAFWFLFKDWLA